MIKVQKLENPYRAGDWHDPMLKWEATDGQHKQHFHIKKDALSFASLWRKNSFEYALNEWPNL